MKKPKVLIVSKFYYRRGGDCVYALNLEQLLRDSGHDVAVFAMRYPDNLPSEWDKYWPSQIDFSGSAADKLAAVGRTLGLGEVRKCFGRLLDDFRPDVVHLNNIHSYLSPVVAEMAHKRGIRVVWTLHDYKLICPAYSCLRRGQVCELCIGGSKLPVARTRCMKGSMAASAVAWLEALRWDRSRLAASTDTFICPSEFMAAKMKQDGFPATKLRVLNNFITAEMATAMSAQPDGENTKQAGPYYCYVGRLSPEKGVDTLLKAASTLPYTLKVAGGGPLADELRARYADNRNIIFLGAIASENVGTLLRGARFSVMPSECYENNPLAVIESLCAGTPVVGARAGGVPELIDHSCGTTFRSGDATDLCAAIRHTWDTAYDRSLISRTAIQHYSPQYYYRSLSDIYTN